MLRWTEPSTGNDGGSESGIERIVVIDTGPDFREQALRERLTHVDAVLYTHAHADHILGMDDLRPLSFIAAAKGGPIPLYADQATAAALERIFAYTFSPKTTYLTRARVELIPLAERNTLFGVEFVRIPLLHGEQTIAGFRFGNAAYLTDHSDIPPESMELLSGLDVLFLDALRHKPHPTHSTVERSLESVEKLTPRRAFFTHICHDLGHACTEERLPPHVRLAYDGLEIEVGSKT